MKKQRYTLTAAFPDRQPRPVELCHEHSDHCAFHAAGNLDPEITEQHLVLMHLTFLAPTSPLLPDEPNPTALHQAQRFLHKQIRLQYTATGDIKWKVKTA